MDDLLRQYRRISQDRRKELIDDVLSDDYLRVKIYEFIKNNKCCDLNTLAEDVLSLTKYGFRGKKREIVHDRIWKQVDILFESNLIEQYQNKTKNFVRIVE